MTGRLCGTELTVVGSFCGTGVQRKRPVTLKQRKSDLGQERSVAVRTRSGWESHNAPPGV